MHRSIGLQCGTINEACWKFWLVFSGMGEGVLTHLMKYGLVK